MAWFARRPKTLVPSEVLNQLNSFGNASWDSKVNTQPITDPRFDWSNFFSKFLPAYQADLTQAIAELHAAAGADPLARYGGYRVVAEFDGACKDPLYLDMMDAALQMMYDRGLSSAYMTGYERDRWVETHGDIRTSFDRIVEVATPAIDAVSGIELEPGQSLMVTMQGPGPLDNQFWIERPDETTYGAFSMRLWDSDAVTLTRCEEREIGTFDTLEGVLRRLGAYLRTPSYWVHPELDPYFTERRMG